MSTRDTTEARQFALHVQPMQQQDHGGGYRYVTWHAEFVEVQRETDAPYRLTIRNIHDRWDPATSKWDRRDFECLTLRAQADDGRNRTADDRARVPAPYAFGAAYQSRYSVGLDDAEAMAYTLRTVQKGLEKLREEEGECRSFGQYIVRVAKLLRVKTAVRRHDSQWSAERYQLGTLGDAAGWMDQQVDTWAREVLKRENPELAETGAA